MSDVVRKMQESEEIDDMLVELAEYREIFATAFPCGWPEPFAELKFKGTPYVSWDALENGEPSLIDPDEALGLGVAIIRAALVAKESSDV